MPHNDDEEDDTAAVAKHYQKNIENGIKFMLNKQVEVAKLETFTQFRDGK